MISNEENGERASNIDKARKSRANYAGWLTRIIDKTKTSSSSPSALQAIKSRVQNQLTKLQSAHDNYLELLEDEEEMNEAEDWFDSYFTKAMEAFENIDIQIRSTQVQVMLTTQPSTSTQSPATTTQPSASTQSPAITIQPSTSTQSPATTTQPSTSTQLSVAALLQNADTVNEEEVEESADRIEEVSEESLLTSSTSSQSLNVNAPSFEPSPNSRLQVSIDAWIDNLVTGRETVISPPSLPGDVAQALARLELERELPRVELPTFDGSPITWPRFIEQFYVQVHSRYGLSDARRMDILQSHVRGDAKKLVQGLGYSSYNYAQSLKELKFAFGHRIMVAQAYVCAIIDGNVVPSGNASALRDFYIAVRDCITTLRQMNYTSELHSSDVLRKTAQRIPFDKRVKWNDYVRRICRTREPSLPDLEKWLRDCIEAEFNPYAVSTQRNSNTMHSSHAHIAMNTAGSPTPVLREFNCELCSSDHHISRCQSYLDKNAEDRYELVKSKRLCFNCLHSNHRISDCKSTNICKVKGCGKKHHTSLHRSKSQTSTPTSSETKAPATDAHVNNVNAIPRSRVYFQVLPVIAHGSNGRRIRTFALLDSASDITLVSEDLAKNLGLNGHAETLTLNTLSSPVSIPSKRVSFSITGDNYLGSQPLYIKGAWTKPGGFKSPPMRPSDIKDFANLKGLGLVDIEPDKVQLLIGANVPRAHVQIDCHEGQHNGLVAVKTLLGWCVLGESIDNVNEHVESISCKVNANVNFVVSDHDLSKQVEQFWKTESFGVTAHFNKPTSMEDLQSIKMLEKGIREVDGHYEVPMLWKSGNKELPNNRLQAEKRFSSLTHRLSKDLNLQENYTAVMNGYISSGYARQLTPKEEATVSNKTWYLPHHCVLNPNKPGKVRVVFDAAAECDRISLNNQLMTGPDLMNSLFSVIQRFRMHSVALVADIKEMFHQVKVSDVDSDSLRFLWKEDISTPGPAKCYKMLVHIFGARDSPCCVNFALRKSSEETDKQVRNTILYNFYVDDMLKSVENTDMAVSLASRISQTLQHHGFELTKWISNSREVLECLPKSQRAISEIDLDFGEVLVQRALGLSWDIQRDSFVFRPVVKEVPMTKRAIISAVSSVFDPCGFLAPYTFRAKCLIQDLWRSSLGWDDPVPGQLYEKWKLWQQELHDLSSLQIPRFHGSSNHTNLELHTFCDASEAGFAAVAYLRMPDMQPVKCSILAAKSHVAPIKQVLTIPKLELQGAVMAVRLHNTLRESIPVKLSFFWTDSITVLRYINNQEKKWKIFVANRVSEIREYSEPTQWKYVPSRLNPADDATRGLTAKTITEASRWLHGPEFLQLSPDQWPVQPVISGPSEQDEELRQSSVTAYNTQGGPKDHRLPQFDIHVLINPSDFSSWYRLQRHTAWILRAIHNFKAALSTEHMARITGHALEPSELHGAKVHLVRLAQIDGFPAEFISLQTSASITEKSSLKPLNPFFDDKLGAIRVGGRLRKAPSIVEVKHQLVLPYDHHVTRLIARNMHLKLAHCGTEHLVAELRSEFWPIKCRQMAKSIIHQCFNCRRNMAKPCIPLMADLPRQRITGFSRPFQFSGVDYFGPMIAKRARSRIKKWGCLFTCLVTRAVHIELVDSLSTDDFIMALRCFVSRRGQPSEIYSDNGTNFKGAEKELLESLKLLDQSKIYNFLLQQSTKWHFIPPHAPHFGGVWESLVKSAKRALKAVLKEQVVTESVLRTTLTEVESIINSRPLTYNSSDANDFTALTPNHFLHGGSSHLGPIGEFPTDDLCSRKRWRHAQVLVDHIWRRWIREYLPGLTIRNCWQSEQRNLHKDDLVLLIEDNIARGQWPLARIIEVFYSDDNRIRTVRVKTAQGEYNRPASKICLLEEAKYD